MKYFCENSLKRKKYLIIQKYSRLIHFLEKMRNYTKHFAKCERNVSVAASPTNFPYYQFFMDVFKVNVTKKVRCNCMLAAFRKM